MVKTLSLHVDQIPHSVEEFDGVKHITWTLECGESMVSITFRHATDKHAISGLHFESASTWFIPQTEEDIENESPIDEIQFADAIKMMQPHIKHGDFYNTESERFVGLWAAK